MSTQHDVLPLREWCCRHAWAISYITVVAVLLLLLAVLGA